MRLVVELREYQKNILEICKRKNTLVILPTGTGKTIIAFALMVDRLKEIPGSKVIFLAPTKPLANQHKENFLKLVENLDKTKVTLITGDVKPERREVLYKVSEVIFATPQTLQNDIIEGRVYLDNVSLIIFDEAHRAVKKYPYVFIAKKYIEQAKNPRVLGLTASPGYSLKRVREVVENLDIKAIEIRTGYERDIRKYIKKIKIDKVEVELSPEILNIKKLLDDAIFFRYEKLKDLGIITERPKGKKELKEYYEDLRKLLSLNPRDENIKKSISLLSEIIKVEHALELLETQTLYTFVKYFEELYEKKEFVKSYSLCNFLEDVRIKKAYVLAKELITKNKEHPKVYKLLELIEQFKGKKIIIFAQIINTINRLHEILSSRGVKCEKFLGKKGMRRSEQERILNDFRSEKFDVLLATSVGEEGIDIPKVDVVIFYEPVPSEIRYIQRRGRTGRSDVGEVKILVTTNTRDEVFFWVAITKEKKMLKNIKKLKKYILNMESSAVGSIVKHKVHDQRNNPLTKYLKLETQPVKNKKEDVTVVIADYREKDSSLIQALSNLGVIVKLENLEVGDYIAGEYIIERKTYLDFVKSLMDGRLFEQLEKLKEKNTVLILEKGEEGLEVGINPNYLRSCILKIEIDYGIPIIFTKNPIETANYIYLLAKKSHERISLKITQKQKSTEEIRLEILKQIPGIGNTLAKKLLEKYKTLKDIFEAPLVELEKIVGDKKARIIKKVYGEEFKNRLAL